MSSNESLEKLASREYEWGFTTDIEQDVLEPGLDEGVIRFISDKKGEPAWLLEWRLAAFERWHKLEEPHHWAKVDYPPIDSTDTSFASAP